MADKRYKVTAAGMRHWRAINAQVIREARADVFEDDLGQLSGLVLSGGGILAAPDMCGLARQYAMELVVAIAEHRYCLSALSCAAQKERLARPAYINQLILKGVEKGYLVKIDAAETVAEQQRKIKCSEQILRTIRESAPHQRH